MSEEKQPASDAYRDLCEPGWRQLAAERAALLAEVLARVPCAAASAEDIAIYDSITDSYFKALQEKTK